MLADIIRHYQNYNPVTDDFDTPRSMTEYAAAIGISYVYLSQIYTGFRKPGNATFGKLMRAFPKRSEEIAVAMGRALSRPQEVSA